MNMCFNDETTDPPGRRRQGGRSSSGNRSQPRRLRSDLQFGRIDEILATGLHAYLTQFLDRVNDLGAGIGRDFLVPVAA